MKVVIFANGDLQDSALVRQALEGAQLVIAADGGARHALSLGIDSKIVIGDHDSLDAADRLVLEEGGAEFLGHAPDKDQTDLELALLEAAARGADEITVLGATGGRLDMTVANLMLPFHPELAGVPINFVQGRQVCWLLRPPGGSIRGEIGDTVSLIPLGSRAQGLTSRDLHFPLEDETLEAGPARGVSNVIIGSRPRVELREGALLVILTSRNVGMERP